MTIAVFAVHTTIASVAAAAFNSTTSFTCAVIGSIAVPLPSFSGLSSPSCGNLKVCCLVLVALH